MRFQRASFSSTGSFDAATATDSTRSGGQQTRNEALRAQSEASKLTNSSTAQRFHILRVEGLACSATGSGSFRGRVPLSREGEIG
jgi:hypothetical protein